MCCCTSHVSWQFSKYWPIIIVEEGDLAYALIIARSLFTFYYFTIKLYWRNVVLIMIFCKQFLTRYLKVKTISRHIRGSTTRDRDIMSYAWCLFLSGIVDDRRKGFDCMSFGTMSTGNMNVGITMQKFEVPQIT